MPDVKRSDDADTSRIACAGGVAYATLLRIRELLRRGDAPAARQATEDGIYAAERMLFRHEPKGGDA